MVQEKRKIIVVGGGASGMMAAISAARLGNKVTILEQKENLGKKILVTGNGRCNFTNRVQLPFETYYRTEQISFPKPALEQFSFEDTLAFFSELGMQFKERNGYFYPFSGQASTVLLLLKKELDRLFVQVETNAKIRQIVNKKNQFSCFLEDNRVFYSEQVILCTGSMAAPKTGSDGSGYSLAKQFGHHLIPPLPALCPIEGKDAYGEHAIKGMAGVRTEAVLRLFIQSKLCFQERGELQIVEYGLSGIPIFQLSRYAIRAFEKGKSVWVEIDFFPDLDWKQSRKFFLQQLNRKQKTIEEALLGLLNRKIVFYLLRCAKIKPTEQNLTEKQFEQLLGCLKRFSVIMIGYRGFEQAQVCSGGVNTMEVKADTLESKLVQGLYFAGEILDVDGACGGYNLQWAWSSGFLAGKGL